MFDLSDETSGLTYADAGVDIEAGDALVERIKPEAARTVRPGVMSGLGGFGGLFDLRAAGLTDPILVAATDGVGTKLRLAIETGRFDTIGIDLVAMCVNDLLCQGATPLFFLDYFATANLNVDQAAAVVASIAKGCADSGAALLGGETAEMPGMYAAGDFDLAGFAVGAMERGRGLPRDVAVGDRLIAIASSGPHSNGYSLIRRIVAQEGIEWTAPSPIGVGDIGGLLLTPTRIYVKALAELFERPSLHALSHITGGGLTENLPRILPQGYGAEIDLDTWDTPDVFTWIANTGRIETQEMLRTFNCGVGMLAVVDSNDAASVQKILAQNGESAFEIGRVTDSSGVRFAGTL